jgi:pimeloyl-[acyl-carrier protein] methyl ester esterase
MNTALHIESAGNGPELVLLHGWALHGGVWDTLVPRLAPHFHVTRVDLPGHGKSRGVPLSADLAQVAAGVLAVTPADAIWLGWSLGGLVAMRAALDAPTRLRALVLANGTPRFVTAADWPCAMPPEQLEEFASGLSTDYRGTLQRFLSLQVRGDTAARETLRQLRDSLFARGEPGAADLAVGLELLRLSDLRDELSRLRLRTLVLAGNHDRLTPPAASEVMAKLIPQAALRTIQGAAHAPFLSHAGDFVAALLAFSRELDSKAVRLAVL